MEKLTKKQKENYLEIFMLCNFPFSEDGKPNEELEDLRESVSYKAISKDMSKYSKEELEDMFIARAEHLENMKKEGKVSDLEIRETRKILAILADTVLQGNIKDNRKDNTSMDR